MPFPGSGTVHPLTLRDGSRHRDTVFLRAVIDHPRWEIGAYRRVRPAAGLVALADRPNPCPGTGAVR